VAKLYLKFEANTLKEITLVQGSVISIGRLPDNQLQVDNLAVSGHHARIYWEGDHFVVEDNKSLNGTYVNNQRISKTVLKDDDNILIGKHTVIFKDEFHEDAAPRVKTGMTPVPKLEATVLFDSKKAKEMMAQARGASAPSSSPRAAEDLAPRQATSSESSSGVSRARTGSTAAPKERTGALTVLEGKTDAPSYLLSSKLTVVGGSKMATVKLKGSLFKSPPDVAVMISKRDEKYFISQQDKKAHLQVNGADPIHQQELHEGDVIEVCGVKLAFSYQE
jgi:predicted component of type VI protein secretion system